MRRGRARRRWQSRPVASPARRASHPRAPGPSTRAVCCFSRRSSTRSAAQEAHRLGLRVAAHALDVDAVRRALAAGADVLAHTPVEPLPDDVVRAVAARKLWVISTLHAFGGTAGALDNLRRLRAAGVRVAYGTDLGNQGTAPGIDAKELALLESAGLSLREAIDAATSAAADLLGERDLGHLRRGGAASVIGVPEAALQDARLLARPALVLIEGAPPP